MITAHTITRLAESYSAATGVAAVTLSFRCFGDSKKLQAIAGGADLTLKRYTSGLQWFSDNWPETTPWPLEIERPAPLSGMREAS